MGANISTSDFVLLLRGWLAERRRLRVVLETPTVAFGVFATLYAVSFASAAVRSEL